MKKSELVQQIVERLSHDLELFFTAAKTAHAAATHEENQPDNKYDTLALEASYVAQGQANRAQELRHAISVYQQLPLVAGSEEVCLTSVVTIEADKGARRLLFIGPLEGGLKIVHNQAEIMVITPTSPLGKELLGKGTGDTVDVRTGARRMEYEIVDVY